METRTAMAIIAIAALLGSMGLILALYPPESQLVTRTWSVRAEEYPSESVSFDISLGSAKLTIQQLDRPDLIVDVEARFRSYQAEPVFRAAVSDNALYIAIKAEEPAVSVPESVADSYTLSLGRYGRATSLRLRVGAVTATMRLTDLPLKELSVDIAAGSLAIDLAEYRNPTPCIADLTVGAASLDATGLGNLNFRDLSVKVGAATAKLDFSGDLKPGTAEARVEAGVATVSIRLPRELGCTLSSKVLGVLNLDSAWKLVSEVGGRKEYESPGFSETTKRMLLIVDAGVATVNVERQQD